MTDDERTEAERVDPAENIDIDDPRYDGFRIREYWVATTVAPDNQEAILGINPVEAMSFNLTLGVAMATDERRLVRLRAYAEYAAEKFSVEIKIRHFVPVEGEDEIFLPPGSKND